MPTTWGADWYDFQHSWSLYHILDPLIYNKSMLKTWGGDHNSNRASNKFRICKEVGI